MASVRQCTGCVTAGFNWCCLRAGSGDAVWTSVRLEMKTHGLVLPLPHCHLWPQNVSHCSAGEFHEETWVCISIVLCILWLCNTLLCCNVYFVCSLTLNQIRVLPSCAFNVIWKQICTVKITVWAVVSSSHLYTLLSQSWDKYSCQSWRYTLFL